MTHVVVLPGDGIGPEVAAEAIRVLDALGIAHSEHAFGGNAILDQGTPLPDETLAACRGADAVLLAAVGLPELEGQAGASRAGPARPPQGARRLREPAARARRRDRHDDRPRARRRPLLRREGHPRGRHLVRHVRVLAARGRADRAARLRGRAVARRPADLGRQGERHAHLAAVAGRRHRDGSGPLPGGRARPRARRLLRDDDRAGTRDDRHRRDGEHLRRHPLRHRRRRDRRPRVSPPRRRSPTTGPASSSPCTARRRRSPAGGSRTRRPCSARSR